MAFNPSPKVSAARDYGEKFGFDQVLIIGIKNGQKTFGIVSYGRTKPLCDEADKMSKKLSAFIGKGGIGYF